MTYVALLRGINVGGNNIIKMSALKSCLEREGFTDVTTFIASGNVVFECDTRDAAKLTRRIETVLSKTFGYDSRVVVLSAAQLAKIVARAPRDWSKRSDLRCNVLFLRSPVTAEEAIAFIDAGPGIDRVESGPGVLYASTLLRSLKKSRLGKIIGTKVYKDITIRTYNTSRKILALMERAGANPVPAAAAATDSRRDRRPSR